PEVDINRLRALLGAASTVLGRLFPQLGDAEAALDATATPLDKLRLFEAVVLLLRTLAAEHGLLAVVEDVHWADHSTQELLDYLSRRLRATRTLLLVTHRTVELDRRHPLLPTIQRWRRAELSETILLAPLDLDGVRAMIGEIFDDPQVPADFTR